MKILVIHGSPHKGNTLKLTEKFEYAIKKIGNVEFDYLSVSELNIEMCRGCFNCITKGENYCPIKNDDLPIIIDKIEKSNGVVFSAPTYMYSVPAIMKNLIDRLSYFGHRPKFINKYAVVISTTCGIGLKNGIKYLTFGAVGAWGFKLIGTLGAETHPFSLNKKTETDLNKKINKVALKFYNTLYSNELPRITIEEMIRFQTMRIISSYSKEFFPADYKFYHENSEIGKNYYLKSFTIGFFTLIISKMISIILELSIKKIRNNSDMSKKFLE